MKKSLVALAVLAATGAFAQSSVTLYGRMDLGTYGIKTDSTTAAGLTTTAKANELAGAEGQWTGNRLGVRGSEDLGGGLKANFQYEFRLSPDAVNATAAGAGGSTFGRTRLALLQVAGDFGSVTIGTYMNPFDDIRAQAGIYGSGLNSGGIPGAFTLDKINGATNPGSLGFNGRSTNSIGYRTPVFAGGFTASIGTTMQNTDGGAGAAVSKASGFIGSIVYANGPINVLTAYGAGKSKASAPAVGAVAVTQIGFVQPATPVFNLGSPAVAATSTEGNIKDFGLKASYNFGMAVPYFMFENAEVKSTNLISGLSAGGRTSRGFEIGSTFPMGAFTPFVLFANNKLTPITAAGVSGPVTKTNAFQLGSRYDLSRRTFVYGGFGSSKDTTANSTVQVKSTGYALGLVHNF